MVKIARRLQLLQKLCRFFLNIRVAISPIARVVDEFHDGERIEPVEKSLSERFLA